MSDKKEPVLKFVGMAGGTRHGGIAVGGENINIRGKVDQSMTLVGQEDGEASGGTVVGGKDMVLGSETEKRDERQTLEDPTKGTVDRSVLTFGHDDTVALLVAGAGEGCEIFGKDIEDMEKLLISERVGIDKDNIYPVIQKPKRKTTTKEAIKKDIRQIAYELEGSENGCFIFFFSGHFDDNAFKVGNKGNADDDYSDEELAIDLNQIPAKYVLFILDMCFAGAANVGAKKRGQLAEDVKRKAPMSHLWELFTEKNQTKGKGKGKPVSLREKVVQWASSLEEKESFYGDENSHFTKAIIDAIAGDALKQEIPTGKEHATVLQLNIHVAKQLKGKGQTPIIKPTYADESYFDLYPYFAKIK